MVFFYLPFLLWHGTLVSEAWHSVSEGLAWKWCFVVSHQSPLVGNQATSLHQRLSAMYLVTNSICWIHRLYAVFQSSYLALNSEWRTRDS